MTDKEWIQQTIKRGRTGSVPYNFSFSPPAAQAVRAHYGDDLEENLSLPIRMIGLKSPKPLYASPDEFGDTARDEFGVVWSTSRMDRGVPVGPCLPEPDLAGYVFPDPLLAGRFSGLDEWCSRQEQHFRIIWAGDLWERAAFMRGMENILLDVALNRAFVKALLERLAEHILATIQNLAGRYSFEAVAISDDYGMQKGMLISPADWRELVKPRLSEIYALAKKHGLAVFHHSCGHITPIIGDMIDIGLDILHPIQPEAMDIYFLKRQFGSHLTFCGGIPTQTLLVRATPLEIRDEVRKLKRQMGENGGYILEPGITLQAGVPLENMIAMIDEARAPGC